MNNLLALVSAMIISMVLIPIAVRCAKGLGLLDHPNDRKVHAAPIPRVGGIGIVIGGLTPILFLLPLGELSQAYILGALVLFLFGLWDDRFEIGHYPKFVGQLIAVFLVVFYGGLYVDRFPFFEETTVPAIIGMPFTIIALVGAMNAINHSDGLDGLAGGESLFCLGAISLLGYLSGSITVMLVGLSVIGGILGFLRYNTHPATVFMGDSGSQFLGYTLGFLVVLLTQRVDTSLTPSVVLLLLGLPVVDIVVVLFKRARARKNVFEASRNHIHHRLLDLGFIHQESVIIIYSIQMVFVTTGILLRFESDILIIIWYLIMCSAIFGTLNLAERSGWQRAQGFWGSEQAAVMAHDVKRKILVVLPRRFLAIGIPLFLIGTSAILKWVPPDFAKMSIIVAILMAIEVLFSKSQNPVSQRALIYITATFVSYLGIKYEPDWLPYLAPAKTSFFILIAIAFAVAVKFSPRRRKHEFTTTATDYLVVFLLLATLVISKGNLWGNEGILFVVQMTVIFYGCELLLTERRGQWGGLSTAALLAAAILGVRGIFVI